jgi:formylglycine-generating enzyme required for sulfatase activity
MLRRHFLFFKLVAAAAASCIALSAGVIRCRANIAIETVPIGELGNANDPATGNKYGGVDYTYKIGKYEVTVGQYATFLNAVAAVDNYGLYNPPMATDLNSAGIAQSGVSPNFTYSVIGSPNHPVTYVSWGDAVRFANWVNNGQPTGAEDASTTEDGAYTLNGAITDNALIAVTRNAGAKWFLPTEDEWYKAAYYKNNGQTGDYWYYATQSNQAPNSDQPPGDPSIQANVANVYRVDGSFNNGINDGYAVTGSENATVSPTQNYLTDVGAYAFAPSAYGTFDQTGNVWEWNETNLYNSFRGVRGGSWEYLSQNDSPSTNRGYNFPTHEDANEGFRIAAIPEPSTAALAVVACGMICGLRKRFTS